MAKCWSKPKENKLNVGDVVVVIDPDSLRNDWRLARVIEPTFSKANNLIGAKVRTANGNILQRHLRNLAMLESTALFKGPIKPPEIATAAPNTQAGPSTDQPGHSKQYLGVGDSAGRVISDQSNPGRADAPLGGNDNAQGDTADKPPASKRTRGARRKRNKCKHC